MELQAQAKRAGLLGLPREMRDLIYDIIIPTEKVFIFLLVQDRPDLASIDHFPFDRGYAFPTFQTSIFRVCHQVHAEAIAWWLQNGHFRLAMGEYLGPRNPPWTLSSDFIGKVARCDLTISVPPWPLFQDFRLDPKKLKFGTWMLRRVTKGVVEALAKGQSIRKIEIELRDLEDYVSWTAHADHVPESFIEYFHNPILLPLKEVDNFRSISVEEELASIEWVSSLGGAYYEISTIMHLKLQWEVEKLSGPPKLDDLRAQKDTTNLTGKMYELVKEHDETDHLLAYFDGDWYLCIP